MSDAPGSRGPTSQADHGVEIAEALPRERWASSNKNRNGVRVASTTVQRNGDEAEQDAFYGWDWTATTHRLLDDQTVHHLLRLLDGATVLPGKGYQGWPMSLTSYDAEGFKIGTVYFGGGRDDVHVVSTSAVADRVRPVLAAGDARTARVDTRVDTLLSFDKCASVLEAASDLYGSELIYMEKRKRGEGLGRTIYLGAASSAVRVRLYEKWLQAPGEYAEGTNRIEVQLRPPSRVKGDVSSWDRGRTFCASKTSRDLAQRLGADYAPKTSLHVAKGTPDLERSLEVMGQQYGPAFDRWMSLSGGDLDRVLSYLSRTAAPTTPTDRHDILNRMPGGGDFADRLVSDRRAMDDLLRGAERLDPPF